MKADRKLVGATIVVVAAVAAAVYVMWPRSSVLGKRAAAANTVCAACGHTEHRTLSAVPDSCSSCREKQVYPAIECPKCGAACPLKAMAGPQMRGAQIVCRKCGHQFVPGARRPGSGTP